MNVDFPLIWRGFLIRENQVLEIFWQNKYRHHLKVRKTLFTFLLGRHLQFVLTYLFHLEAKKTISWKKLWNLFRFNPFSLTLFWRKELENSTCLFCKWIRQIEGIALLIFILTNYLTIESLKFLLWSFYSKCFCKFVKVREDRICTVQLSVFRVFKTFVI